MNYNQLQDFLNLDFWGNSVQSYLLALAIFVTVFVLLDVILRGFILQKLEQASSENKALNRNLLISTLKKFDWLFYFSVSAFIAIRLISLSDSLQKSITLWAGIIFTFYIARSIQGVLVHLIHQWGNNQKAQDKNFDATLVQLGVIFINIVLWSIATITVLQNFNVNVATLIGGLGISGIAIAFALQNILADIFASFTIYFDKPFAVGDMIQIGKDTGNVQKIGIKSTKIKTLQGEELIVSNKELTQTRVRNFARLKKRRVSFNLGINTRISHSEMIAIPKIVDKIIAKIDDVEFVRCHLRTESEESLNFEVVYRLDTGDYDKYLDIQQEINFQLKEKLKVVSIG